MVDLPDLEPFHKLEIQHFFEVYRALEPGKSLDTERGIWAGRVEAEEEIARSRLRVTGDLDRRAGPASLDPKQHRNATPAG